LKHADPFRIETMPMKGADRDGQLLREGTRHLIYRGPLRIGEIEETTVVHENGRDYGFHAGLTVMCLRDPERRHPTALLNNVSGPLPQPLGQLNRPNSNGGKVCQRTKVCGCGESKSRATRPSGEAKTPTCRFARSKAFDQDRRPQYEHGVGGCILAGTWRDCHREKFVDPGACYRHRCGARA
jgi:hypothetical protein